MKGKTEDKEVAMTLNQYFSAAVNSLDIIENKSLLTETKNLEDPIEIAITININELFQFSDKILSEVNNLDNKKVGSYENIPTKIFKESSEINCEYLTKIWHEQVIMQKKLPR